MEDLIELQLQKSVEELVEIYEGNSRMVPAKKNQYSWSTVAVL